MAEPPGGTSAGQVDKQEESLPALTRQPPGTLGAPAAEADLLVAPTGGEDSVAGVEALDIPEVSSAAAAAG